MKLQYYITDDNKYLAIKHPQMALTPTGEYDFRLHHLFQHVSATLYKAGYRVKMVNKGIVDQNIGFRYIGSTGYGFFNHQSPQLLDFQSFEFLSGPGIDQDTPAKDVEDGAAVGGPGIAADDAPRIQRGPQVSIEHYLLAAFNEFSTPGEFTFERVGPEAFDELVLNDYRLKEEGKLEHLGDAHLNSAEEAEGCITRETTLSIGKGWF